MDRSVVVQGSADMASPDDRPAPAGSAVPAPSHVPAPTATRDAVRTTKDLDRLVVALDATPLLGVQTGIGVFCHEAMASLGACGELDVRAFAISWRRRHMLASLLPPGARFVGGAMPARPLHLAWRYLEVPYIEWFVGAADVVHGTNFVVPPTHKAAKVVTVHDLTTVRFPEMCEPATLRFPALIRKAVAHGAWVHTPSRYVADEVVSELGVNPERVRAVHHGTPLLTGHPALGTNAVPAPNPVQASLDSRPRAGATSGGLQLPEGTKRYVLAVGTAEPRKDLPGLVKAFDGFAGRWTDVALVLVGQPGWGSGPLQAAVNGSPYRSRIVMPGYVRDLEHVLSGAAVLAYPSLYEGFGLPTLEAMAAGVPVVTTTAGALPEVVGDAAVMVAPKDTEALSQALEQVLTDEELRIGLIERGLKRASLFTWEACAAGLTDLYTDAAASRK